MHTTFKIPTGTAKAYREHIVKAQPFNPVYIIVEDDIFNKLKSENKIKNCLYLENKGDLSYVEESEDFLGSMNKKIG